ncbi:MAG: hypothetical protein ACTSQF_12785 [Candidatus Heimdallarchaeaceae archaeon]
MFRGRRRDYGTRYGRGRGYGAGYGPGWGPGRRFSSPYCDYYPDRPRGWWAMPEYEGAGFVAPPAGARWDPYGKPETPEAIEHEISLIQSQVEALQKEIVQLKSLDKPAK